MSWGIGVDVTCLRLAHLAVGLGFQQLSQAFIGLHVAFCGTLEAEPGYSCKMPVGAINVQDP